MRDLVLFLVLLPACSFVLDVDSVEPRCNAADECPEGFSCVDGVCKKGERCEAVPNAAKRCSPAPGVGGDVRWFDSCGEPQDEIFEDCPDQHAVCVETSDTVAVCECVNHWEGTDCTSMDGT